MTPEEVQEYQQNEIDGAKDVIDDRRDHLGDYRQDGLLDGDFVNDHDNQRLKAYLQGYADACEFASSRVDRIQNLVRYLRDREADVEAWVWEDDDGEWKFTVATEDVERTYSAGHIADGRDTKPLEAAAEHEALTPVISGGDES